MDSRLRETTINYQEQAQFWKLKCKNQKIMIKHLETQLELKEKKMKVLLSQTQLALAQKDAEIQDLKTGYHNYSRLHTPSLSAAQRISVETTKSRRSTYSDKSSADANIPIYVNKESFNINKYLCESLTIIEKDTGCISDEAKEKEISVH
eukprot:UN13532